MYSLVLKAETCISAQYNWRERRFREDNSENINAKAIEVSRVFTKKERLRYWRIS